MKVSREERARMTHDELLRAVWLLDELAEKRDWIPVSKRLPENRRNPATLDEYVYPVTVSLDGVTDVRYYSFWQGHWYNQGPKVMDHIVIAWMPRPAPYMPEV